MAVTPEKLSEASVVLLFLFLTLVIAGVLYLPTKNAFVSVGAAVLAVSALLIAFYSQETGIFAVFIFVVVAVVFSLLTMKLDAGFLAASLAAGAFVIYSLVQ